MEEVPSFNPESSPIKEAYRLLGATTPLELDEFYTREDQRLFTSGAWDYNDPTQLTNQVKAILESTSDSELSDDQYNEPGWRNEILWFWYHHAISCAIWRYGDKQSAQKYSEQALVYQSEDHPNQITKLLCFLTNDQLDESENWTTNITDEVEKQTAEKLIDEYKKGQFYAKI